MNKMRNCIIICLLLFAWQGCSKKTPSAPDTEKSILEQNTANLNPQHLAEEMIQQIGWEIDAQAVEEAGIIPSLKKSHPGLVSRYLREPLPGNIAHYTFIVRTGSGPYDEIGIHRVVKEKRAFAPIKSSRNLFLQHGDAKDFTGIFQPGIRSANTADEHGIAWFLADSDVDVWGIDQAWTLVPSGMSDVSFMADWGLDRQVADLSFALSIARFSRLLTGAGSEPMILSGYSSGVVTGYALLNEETQLAEKARNVRGFIPVDLGLKLSDPYLKGFFADYGKNALQLIANGQACEEVAFQPLGYLARTDPDGASPILSGMTNMQAALLFAGGQVFGEGSTFHYIAAKLENGMPVSLHKISIPQWLDFLEASVAYEPWKFEADYCALFADASETKFDDHVAEITVPIFNVAAAGGIGELSRFGTTLLGSSDITHLIVQLGATSTLEEFGHIDLFTAENAPILVWQPILDWIRSHSSVPRYMIKMD